MAPRFTTRVTVRMDPAAANRIRSRLDQSHSDTLEDVAQDARMRIARKAKNPTGRLAGSIRTVRRGDDGFVFSDAPHAGAIERGAWARGRGPHISRAAAFHYLRDAGRRWPYKMRARLKGVG